MLNYHHDDIFGHASTKAETETFTSDMIEMCDETNEEYIDDDPLIKPEIEDQEDEFHLIEDDFMEPQFEDLTNAPKIKYRNTYRTEDKLEAVKLAEQSSNRKASKVLSIDESCIRKWRSQKKLLEKSGGRINIKHPKPAVIIDDAVIEPVVQTVPTKIEGAKQEGVIKNRKSYSSGEKLEAVKYAEVTGEMNVACLSDNN